jgi:predicted AAA+ superfamily ATPase
VEEELKSIFETNKNPQRIIELLGLLCGQKIIPGSTLIIFDEIQECPAALNALKYFKEKANEYHIITAGSLLGTLLAQPQSYPVGQVNLLELYPLTFDEFLAVCDDSLYRYYMQIECAQTIETIFIRYRLAEIIPMEMKSGETKHAATSFKSYLRNRQPRMAIRFSKRGYVTDGNFTNLPLYLAKITKRFI